MKRCSKSNAENGNIRNVMFVINVLEIGCMLYRLCMALLLWSLWSARLPSLFYLQPNHWKLYIESVMSMQSCASSALKALESTVKFSSIKINHKSVVAIKLDQLLAGNISHLLGKNCQHKAWKLAVNKVKWVQLSLCNTIQQFIVLGKRSMHIWSSAAKGILRRIIMSAFVAIQ